MGKQRGVSESPVYTFFSTVLTGATGTVTTSVRTSVANPTGKQALIQGIAFVATTQSAGACTVDVGVAADATTVGDNLLDGQSVAAAGVSANRISINAEFVNLNVASGTITGLVGYLAIKYSIVG
jgi:hypothetical protein